MQIFLLGPIGHLRVLHTLDHGTLPTEPPHNLLEAVLHMVRHLGWCLAATSISWPLRNYPGSASGRSLSRLDGYFCDQDRFKERSYLI